MNTRLVMERMFPPQRLLSKPQKIEKEALKDLAYLPDIFSPTMKHGSYEDFFAQMKKKYGDISIKKLISKANLKLINSGRESSVYEIEGVENYVLKVKKENRLRIKYGFTGEFKKVENRFYGHNFGQPVAENPQGAQILMKVDGKPFSVDNWVEYYSGKKDLTQKNAESLLKQMEKLAEFPQESFNDLAKRIKFIYMKLGKVVDSFNPNNFIVDTKKKQINLIDLEKADKNHWACTSCSCTLTNPLTDGTLSFDFKRIFTPKQQETYDALAKTIEKKCEDAYEKHKLLELK